ncbi:transcription factor [Labrys okinawensis]|uniref:Transcription factor n=1 Tax=Labrys okinawensis TaxID=346911 RepID=A0A2S9QB85_9HYPH|nr:cupin-like domain-containing protein [Labrys okinawensis]PRH86611.1 transcription factor [Labrys okinawensis]
MNIAFENEIERGSYSNFDKIEHILETDQRIFKENYNVRPFKLHHTLCRSGLFEIPEIVKTARSIIGSGNAADFLALDLRRESISSKFTEAAQHDRLTEVIDRLGESGSWIRLSRTQDYNRDYARVLAMLIDEIGTHADRPFRQEVTWATLTVILTSPGISTPFHIDHESNFLFQIKGEKEVCLFDPGDREVLPEIELERFYASSYNTPRYKPELQGHGQIYRLTPGEAVHHPPVAPHWVKNGDNISVSLSISFCMRPLERRARIYQANFMLRQLRLKPRPPGLSPGRDALKARLVSALEMADPKTFQDIVYSPMNRLKSPMQFLKKVSGRRVAT